MGKFDGILICTDLDGTLLRNDKSVSRENLDAIEYFKAEGGYFTFITGRMPMTTVHICENVQPNAPFGCINGGGIFDYKKQEFVRLHVLDREVLELVDYVDREMPDMGIQINTEKTIYCSKDTPAMVRFRQRTGTPKVTGHWRDIDEPIAKVVFAHLENEKVLKLAEILYSHPKSKEFDFIRSERTLYEILPNGISKATALVELAEILKVNKIVAVGDYNNDVSMIKAATVGVAVGNACIEAKAAADVITVSNEEHAIAKIIQGIETEEIKF